VRPSPSSPAVEARGLAKRFGETQAVDGIDLDLRRGEIRGLVGPNGAGKTTLLRLLLGLARPDSGAVSLLGSALDRDDPRVPEGVAGFVEEPRFYPYLSVRRNLQLLARLDGGDAVRRIDEALERTGLAAAANRRAGGLSTGMRQRLGLAASLIREPSLLVLDEPAAGLDPAGAAELHALVVGLGAAGAAILLSSHDMAEVERLCQSVTIVASGRALWDGPLAELRGQAPPSVYRLATNDDAAALHLAAAEGLDAKPTGEGTLALAAEEAELDRYVLKLGLAGIAVRLLEVERTPLEAMYFALTGAVQ
jgi:ABC-2 type transport system ATP-binding protein